MSTTSGRIIKTAERRAYVLGLRKAGATYRDIANATIQRFGVDELPLGYDCLYCYKDVKRELAKVRKEMGLDVEHIRSLELERLDALLLSIWPMAIPGKDAPVDSDTRMKAIDRALKIINQRARLVPDLDQAQHDGVVIQVIGGVDLDDL